MAELREVTTGLRFPEGPIAMPDGSVVLVEMFGPAVSRVKPDGSKEVIAEIPGGPERPRGRARRRARTCATTVGASARSTSVGSCCPGRSIRAATSAGASNGSTSRPARSTDLYTECDGHPLRAPNDIVFDTEGGFWFTDHGIREERSSDRTGIYYAKADGSSITEVIFPTDAPNGIGLSPAGDMVYYAETHTGRVYQRRIVKPGEVAAVAPLDFGAVLLCGSARPLTARLARGRRRRQRLRGDDRRVGGHHRDLARGQGHRARRHRRLPHDEHLLRW